MGHPAPVLMVLAGGTSQTAYPGARPAHPPASHRSRRPAPTRTSLASRRSSFLAASAKITEILHVSTTSTPAGFVVTILYCHWHLPAPISTPPRSSIPLRHPSPVRTSYMGPTLTDEGWFSEIFGGMPTNPEATLLTLTSSTGRPTALGAVPAGFSNLSTLPDIVEKLIFLRNKYFVPAPCIKLR